MRCWLGKRQACVRTYKMLRIMVYGFRLHVHHCKGAFAEVQGGHDRFADTFHVFFRRLQPVHDQFYEMRLVAVQGSDFIQFEELSVNPYLRISALAHLFKQFLVMSFPAFYDRREQVTFPVLVIVHYK